MRVIACDGSPGSAAELCDALAAALGGGPGVAPVVAATAAPPAPAPAGSVVIRTSGSAGEPKHVLLSAAALHASASASLDRLGGPGRWVLALPTHHVAGVQVLVRSLLAGTEPAVLDLRVGFDPDAFTALADRAIQAGRHYTALVPTQLVRLLGAGHAATLRGFDAVLLGGAGTPPDLREQAADAGVRLVSTYGMSETAGGCVYDGWPLDGVRVRLDDGGRIEVGGPVLADGYLGRPDLTAEAFHGGWLRTGDLGELDDRGRLRVLGRADEVIVTGGEKVAPTAVEAALGAQQSVAQACVVGLPDPEWGQRVVAAVVPADPAAPPAPGALREAVRAGLGPAAVPKEIVIVDALPLLGPGKADRAAVSARLTTCIYNTSTHMGTSSTIDTS